MNASSYANHVAFAFPAINRGAIVFPVQMEKLPHARQCCDVMYHRTRADGTAARGGGRGVVSRGVRCGRAVPAA